MEESAPREEEWEDVGDATALTARRFETINAAKDFARAFILDRRESWAPQNNTNKKRLILKCRRADICDFHLRVAADKEGRYGVNRYIPHSCPPNTHYNFKGYNAA